MLPGRTFLPEDLVVILRRRIWLILVPFAVVSAATALYARWLPDLYRADALIAVVPPKVQEGVLKAPSQSPTQLADRIPAIRNELMSRTRLERIIQDLNLYAVERRTGIMEDIIERMKGEISVLPVGQSAIRVQFVGDEPRTVAKVADRLAALFIDESTKDRRLLIEGTDQFLEQQLKEAETRLIEKEKAVLDFRNKHEGELPDQLGANQQAIQNLQIQIANLVSAEDKDKDRLMQLERQIADYANPLQIVETPDPVVPGKPPSTKQQLAAAYAKLLELQTTHLESHPDVQKMKRTISDLQLQEEREAVEVPVSGPKVVSPAELARVKNLAAAQDQLRSLRAQMDRNQKELHEARQRALLYQRKADAAPTRQTEMVALNRDYTTIVNMHAQLLAEKEKSNLASSLERREIGEQFRMVDGARVPARPYSPQREQLNFVGMAVGLVIGLAIAGLLEYRDDTLKTDDDLTRVFGVPVLAVVPLMQSEQERRRAFQRKLAVNAVLGSTVFGCLAILTYTFVR